MDETADGVRAWKRYPYVPDWGDPHWFTFPACDGDGRALGVQTYFVDGFLRGRTTGRQYAFVTVFTDARVLDRTLRFSFYTLALFDCDRRHYGTYTDFDWPDPSAGLAARKIATAPAHLDLVYTACARDDGPSTSTRRGARHKTTEIPTPRAARRSRWLPAPGPRLAHSDRRSIQCSTHWSGN